MLMKTNEFNYFEQTFMNLSKLIIQVLDDGENNQVKDIKWSSLRISKWLFLNTTFVTPLIACLLGSTFMNVNSKDFLMLVIPILMNWGIFLCWVLFNLVKISRKQMMVLVIVAVAISAAVNMMYIKRKPEINPVEYWNRLSNYSDDELLHEYLAYMDNDTNRACKSLFIPKRIFVRLLEGTSKPTRYASTQIKNTLIEIQCYGKDYILGSNRMDIDIFLNDSISNYLHPLWEKPKTGQ